MKTPFDWITIAIFAGLIVLLMQRSTGDGPPRDALWQYLVAALGCAATNYLGNHGLIWPAIGALLATIVFIQYVLKPFDFQSRS